jgi:uncharacterized protein YecT (DUF1311 family)
MKQTLFFSCIFLLSAFLAKAQEEAKPHPIEVKSKACYDKAVSTHDMIECADKDYTAWDKEMNKVYQALLKKVDKSAQTMLRESQRAWITYRDNAFKFSDDFMGKMDGTMWQPISIERKTDLVKERAIFLQRYLDDLSMN